MSVVCVAKYLSVERALVARSKLQFYGIPANFPEEHSARLKWIYLQGASYCHIEVPKSCAQDALWLLQEENIQCHDYDDYGNNVFFKIMIWLALFSSSPVLAIPVLLDCLYHHLKK